MSNLVCQINPGKAQFQGMHKAESVLCPNCNTTLTSCHSTSRRLTTRPASPCQNCQRCLMVNAPCIAAGMVPYFPLPYVCRHWLSVSPTRGNSEESICSRNNPCMQPPMYERTISRPVSQIEVTSTNPFILTGGKVQRLDIDTTFKDGICMSSRSNSPDTGVIIPDIIFSLNGVPVAKIHQPWSIDDDKEILSKTKEYLETSGWFYGNLTWQEAAGLLNNSKEGKFLIRNSSSPRCPYALSVQTSQGPTSIRIEYERGKFWLDCERKGVTPQFENIMKLVAYYQQLENPTQRKITSSKIQETTAGKNIWVDSKGRIFSPISITEPLLNNPPSLKHRCRLSINSKIDNKLLYEELPVSLILYLSKYPYEL